MTTPKRSGKDALVCSGGGAKGAYEVGVMKALFEGRSPSTDYEPLSVEILTGTSVGAYNVAFLASQDAAPLEATERLEAIWRGRIANRLTDCGNGVFRLRDGPLELADPGCDIRPLTVLTQSFSDAGFWARYLAVRGTQFLANTGQSTENRILRTINLASFFDARPLYSLIADTIDRDRLGASDKELTIAATNWEAGNLSLFTQADLAGTVGLKGIAASTAIPGIFPPVPIGGVPHHDGGVVLNTPLRPAIRAGAEVIHVIFLDPEVADIPLGLIPNTIDTVYRMFLIMSSRNFRFDIELAASITRELELHRDLGILDDEMKTLAIEVAANSRVLGRLLEGRPYRPITIHQYRPKTDLNGGVGLIDFGADFIDKLVVMGYRDAVEHDCEAMGCVLPKGRQAR